MGIWQKTFGGLDKAYYFRHFIFGAVLAVILIWAQSYSAESMSARTGKEFAGMDFFIYIFYAICALLYPYARFVYESIVNFIIGNNFFIVNAVFLLIWKLVVMIVLFAFSIIIAPVGLAYLYYHHTKNRTFDENSSDYFEFIEKGDEK
ncbi:hypothetical protein OFO10_00145 [Campylobacter sp. VBCF_06 NA8]|uniref:hypothetical protein n=1 Tax=Campylobacter sp. VBCF_06 NA8 TaxID=2983822 RepID=UPI0022E9FD2E|nr:hypothetical protein [Campylobacter sp. VBCF_06 NA8]MDA3045576.1 hypothetical protein [Campylobacter sp. VBCF_06 NA8]